MEYYLNELDPQNFQKLVSSILLSRFGEDFRTTPIRGADGGRNGETAKFNPYFEFSSYGTSPLKGMLPPRKGRYLFQVKHYKTTDTQLSVVRKRVISDFIKELKSNVLNRKGKDRVNYFLLVTNVPSSGDSLFKLDKRIQRLISKTKNLHIDIWWKEQLAAYLDQLPMIWVSFPEIFAGRLVPVLGAIVAKSNEKLPHAIRLAIRCQYERDTVIKFRQIDLEKRLSRLFVDLYIRVTDRSIEHFSSIFNQFHKEKRLEFTKDYHGIKRSSLEEYYDEFETSSEILSLKFLMDETDIVKRIILEGGPGQGKSTITQMLAQIYRENILGKSEIFPEKRWNPPLRARIPFRIELREYAEFLIKNPRISIEKFLTEKIHQDSGGNEVSVAEIQNIFEKSPILLIFDGLDEIGSDELRDKALKRIKEILGRFENNGSDCDLKIILTTRPPAIAGRRKNLLNFINISLESMDSDKIDEYLERWLKVQVKNDSEKIRIRNSFQHRKHEPHVKALARNPMQLSVLLHFIRLKGEAFPDRRAELYRDYFQIVIDRDVEKSKKLREQRQLIEALHQFLGYKIHSLTEAKKADGSLVRSNLLRLVEEWLRIQGENQEAGEIFKIGEERFGLIVVLKGEGDNAYYGYEIQPIREYFAAAFINEQIEGDANKIFQKMIRRSFWKEVAIFLAGLRRPNEKADLIARAKSLDDDQLGWKLEGRNLVFQLLQEGIFSTPNHIFLEAVDYLIDFLDPRIIRNPNENDDILMELPALINQNRGRRHINRIKRLVEEYCSSDDEYVVYRIYKVASDVLEPQDVKMMFKSFKSNDPNLIAKVKLVWPYYWRIDLQKEIEKEEYWKKIPEHIWAKNWMKAAIRNSNAMKLKAPYKFHRFLINEFAFNFEGHFLSPQKIFPFQSEIKWAIWHLIKNQLLLIYSFASGIGIRKNSQIKKDLAEIINEEKNEPIDYHGLDQNQQNVIKFFNELTRNINKILQNKNANDAIKLILKYQVTINNYLNEIGLISALSARCLSNILEAINVSIYLDRRKISELPEYTEEKISIEAIMSDNNEMLSILRILNDFFKSSSKSNYTTTRFIIPPRVRSLSSRIISFFFVGQPIDYIRLEKGKPLISIIELIYNCKYNDIKLPFNWVKFIPISTRMMVLSIDKYKDSLENYLVLLGELKFVDETISQSLSAPYIQQIMKLIRNSNDDKLIIGGARLLSGSNFIKIAKSDNLLKMIKIYPKSITFSRIINQQIRSYRTERTDGILEIIIEVLKKIHESPEEYPFRIVCTASKCLAKIYSGVNLPPILLEEEDLKIFIRQCSD